MILGILSDSHGKTQRCRYALHTLRHCGAETIVHCGDLGPGILEELAAFAPACFVWGNMDFPSASDARLATSLGLTPPAELPMLLEIGSKRIAILHGHEPAFRRTIHTLQNTADRVEFHYLLHGHTHRADDRRVGPVRVINPGALHRARTYTCATLDPDADELTFWRIDDDVEPSRPQAVELRDL